MLDNIDILDFNNLSFGQARDLENCMKDMREEYNEMIADISKKQNIGSLWWLTSISSRNIFQSPLFTRCAQLFLLSHYFGAGVQIRHIICPDKAMAAAVKEHIQSNRRNPGYLPIISYSKKSVIRRIRRVLAYVYFPTIAFAKLLWRHITLLSKYKTDLPENRNITLLDMFVMDSTISKSGYTERYYSGLLSYFGSDEVKDIFMFPFCLFTPKNFRAKYKMMLKMKNPAFLPGEQFLRLKDYFSAYVFAFRYRRQKYGNIQFNGFNVGRLLINESKSAFWDNTISNYLRYKAIERLHESGIKIRYLLDWYEGQALDRATLYAFNKFFPDAGTIAYCGGHTGDLSLQQHVIPTKYEQEAGMTAKVTAVMGKGMADTVQVLNDNLNIMIAPALRYRESWIKKYTIGKRVVVALSLFEDVRTIMINSLLDAIGRYKNMQDCGFILSKHPADHSEYTFDGYCNISLSNDAFPELLEDCAVLITGTGTTTGMETMAKGIPVIVMAKPNNYNINYIPDTITRDIWELCYTAEDLTAALNRFLNLSEAEKQELREIGNSIRGQYFERTTRENVRRLLGLG